MLSFLLQVLKVFKGGNVWIIQIILYFAEWNSHEKSFNEFALNLQCSLDSILHPGLLSLWISMHPTLDQSNLNT